MTLPSTTGVKLPLCFWHLETKWLPPVCAGGHRGFFQGYELELPSLLGERSGLQDLRGWVSSLQEAEVIHDR